MTAWGLIAGLQMADMGHLRPGFVCDLFVIRRNYDDEQHGIRRQKDDHDISDEDAVMFQRLAAGEEVGA